MTQKESSELWDQLTERVKNHNTKIATKLTPQGHTHIEVIEKPSAGVLLCKSNSGHLSIMMGDDKHNVGDIISFLPTGEKAGDAVGMNIINKTNLN